MTGNRPESEIFENAAAEKATASAAPKTRASRSITVKPSRMRLAWSEAGWLLFAWLLIAALWELGAYTEVLNPRILPPPSETIPYLLQGPAPAGIGAQRTTFLGAIFDTLSRVAIGYLLGILAALLVGALIVRYKPLRRVCFPIVQTLAPVSPVAWIPFAIALVGIGSPAAIFVVFMAIFGSMTVSAVAAFDSVPEEMLKVGRSLGTSSTHMWTRVIIPAAAPDLMVMARMSFFAAWMAVLAGEMAGINSGLGYLIILGQQMYNMKLVMVGIITIGVLGFVIDRLLLLIQRRLLWWEYRR
ncbi:ABC transporter permease [Thiomicrorhabdus sp. 6S3-12]|uniref:ABC transporter permease n=1 Tax=Thiomicrorhabdus sp. 6S3-12 TaxID=2819681 RepID=UPI001AAD1065|nr:ABC transporter permease [Thiomicrorhabdus sp. 6S3-12]MBO1924173.1 ABC transporter permease [Thiomicrorhabdus sp. 6S3-12]